MLNLFTLAILGLAAARVTQLIVWDSILDGPRGKLEMWHAAKHESKVRTFFRDLFSCVFCVGWWASGAVLAAYLTVFDVWAYTSLWTHGIEWLAVAGIQQMLNRRLDTW